MKKVTTKVPQARLGTPGYHGLLSVRPIFASPPKALPADAPDRFSLTCVLSKVPAYAVDSIDIAPSPQSGSSYLSIPSSIDEIALSSPIGTFRLLPNASGELAAICGAIAGSDVTSALAAFLDAVNPCLDHLSYLSGAPLHIARVHCTDGASHSSFVTYVAPFPTFTLQPSETSLLVKLLPIYALYREAKSVASPYYPLLCYFKILEGIFHSLRPELYRRARELGVRLSAPPELVPPHPDLSPVAARWVGRPVQQFFDEVLVSEYRDLVAHFAKTDLLPLNASLSAEESRFRAVLLPVDLSCRLVISNQEQLYRELAPADRRGTVA